MTVFVPDINYSNEGEYSDYLSMEEIYDHDLVLDQENLLA